MSKKVIMLTVLAGVGVLLAAGLAVAAAGGTGKASKAQGCRGASQIGPANDLTCRNQGAESRLRCEQCEQAEKGACAGDCERLREQSRIRDGEGECPCEGTGKQYRNGAGTDAGKEAPGSSGEASYRYGGGYSMGGAANGNCAGDCLRDRDRTRNCTNDGSGRV